MLAALRSRSVLSMLATATVVGLGLFGAPAPAQAGGTAIVVATPGVFVAIGDRDHKRSYRDYDRGYKYRDFKYRDDGYRRFRDYDRRSYRDRGYHRGYYRRDNCHRRYRY